MLPTGCFHLSDILEKAKTETPYVCRDINQVSVWEGLGLSRGVDYKGHKRIFYGDENPVS